MERILGLSLVGAGPGNVFGPGMSAGVLDSFAGGGHAGGNSSRGAAGRTVSSAQGSGGGGKKSAGEIRSKTAVAEAVGGQEEGRVGGGDDASARLHPALYAMFSFEAVAPH
ncbi:hypothetical protein HU200_003945 [Digitaria exilis]|uniref:Uncharacterized protein n=1 Tax=Digitaria exilis TaxID=1010633 RepID=A0A835FVW7_9POAL|nr:hypothetical protein HU200_003945 [Digitaria exilis]